MRSVCHTCVNDPGGLPITTLSPQGEANTIMNFWNTWKGESAFTYASPGIIAQSIRMIP